MYASSKHSFELGCRAEQLWKRMARGRYSFRDGRKAQKSWRKRLVWTSVTYQVSMGKALTAFWISFLALPNGIKHCVSPLVRRSSSAAD